MAGTVGDPTSSWTEAWGTSGIAPGAWGAGAAGGGRGPHFAVARASETQHHALQAAAISPLWGTPRDRRAASLCPEVEP